MSAADPFEQRGHAVRHAREADRALVGPGFEGKGEDAAGHARSGHRLAREGGDIERRLRERARKGLDLEDASSCSGSQAIDRDAGMVPGIRSNADGAFRAAMGRLESDALITVDHGRFRGYRGWHL